MKDTILSILQQRMDKCTNEQFWAVASLTAIDGFFISERADSRFAFSDYWSIVTVVFSALYGVWFVWRRHWGYYDYRDDMAKLLKNEKEAPEFMKMTSKRWTLGALSGVVFYIVFILLGASGCLLTIIKQNE